MVRKRHGGTQQLRPRMGENASREGKKTFSKREVRSWGRRARGATRRCMFRLSRGKSQEESTSGDLLEVNAQFERIFPSITPGGEG